MAVHARADRRIPEVQVRCQQMHFAGYLIAVLVYPVLYTYVGMFPDSFLARHTQPHPAIQKDVQLVDTPITWWSLVEIVSWAGMPGCRRMCLRSCQNVT